jgi:protein transport protein SEC24
MDFVVALDVSRDAIVSGFLQSTCEALLKVLCGHDISDGLAGSPDKNTEGHQSRPWPRGSRVAIITFDRNIHFHHLGVRLPQRLVIFLKSHSCFSFSVFLDQSCLECIFQGRCVSSSCASSS